MAENMFIGLPPPSYLPAAVSAPSSEQREGSPPSAPPPPPPPRPALKSALKRANPSEPQAEAGTTTKRLRFKTTTDATTLQVIEAMKKIASHIKNPSKFCKASKLAVQLIQAGSVKDDTSDHFFGVLEAAMSSPIACTDPSVRADYHELLSAAQDIKEHFNEQKKCYLTTWTVRAVLANDMHTDDSFVFSKAATKLKEAIVSLPSATPEDDMEEEAAAGENKNVIVNCANPDSSNMSPDASSQDNGDSSDPFGLDALLPRISNNDEKVKGKKEAFFTKEKARSKGESERYLKSQREALILCLETAARRYKIPWTQTVIDILVKHAYDHKDRFTAHQRDAIEKLWDSIREQQIRRKQGKSVSGKLDMNAFEFLQEKYANQKISIRHAVGGAGERRAEQWLG